MSPLTAQIDEVISEIISRGCEIPKEILRNYFDTTVSLAKAEYLGEINDRYIDAIGRKITEPEELKFIKPEDMVKGEWYAGVDIDGEQWVFKFISIQSGAIISGRTYAINSNHKFVLDGKLISINEINTIRPATREEVQKYFPDETFETKINTELP